MEVIISMDSRGRMSLPANIRKELNMENGGDWVANYEDGKITLTTRQQQVQEHIQKLQALIQNKLPGDISLANELIADRQAEAMHEADEKY